LWKHYQVQKMQQYDFTIEFSEPARDVYLLDAQTEKLRNYEIEREKEIYMRGRIEGEQILSQQLIQQRAQMQELQNGLFDSLKQSVPLLAAQCEPILVELAVEVCKKIVDGLSVNAEMISASIKTALKQVGDTSEITVFINPEDLAILKGMRATEITGNEGVKLVPSNEVSRGGCVVQTKFGIIDNRRETKVKIIKKSLQC